MLIHHLNTSSWWNVSFLSVIHFPTGLFLFSLLSFESTLQVPGTSPFRYVVCTYFLSVCVLSFHPLNRVFGRAHFKFMERSDLSIFLFVDHAFGVKILCLALHPEDCFSKSVCCFMFCILRHVSISHAFLGCRIMGSLRWEVSFLYLYLPTTGWGLA